MAERIQHLRTCEGFFETKGEHPQNKGYSRRHQNGADNIAAIDVAVNHGGSPAGRCGE